MNLPEDGLAQLQISNKNRMEIGKRYRRVNHGQFTVLVY